MSLIELTGCELKNWLNSLSRVDNDSMDLLETLAAWQESKKAVDIDSSTGSPPL